MFIDGIVAFFSTMPPHHGRQLPRVYYSQRPRWTWSSWVFGLAATLISSIGPRSFVLHCCSASLTAALVNGQRDHPQPPCNRSIGHRWIDGQADISRAAGIHMRRSNEANHVVRAMFILLLDRASLAFNIIAWKLDLMSNDGHVYRWMGLRRVAVTNDLML